MSKRNIAYIKPQDPKFLRQLKQQIGYKEGPSVETKRQKLEDLEGDSNNEDGPERADEKPQIVVLSSGDLTADEVAIEERRLAKEAAETPADLSKPLIFRKREKAAEDLETVSSLTKNSRDGKKNKDKRNKRSENSYSKTTVKLSFNAEEEEADQ